MKNATLLPMDIYQVVNKSLLSESDKLVLSMLYMPIISNLAVSLYETLYNELKSSNYISKELSHKHLVTLLGVSLGEIKAARIKLEGVGLLKTYVMEGSVSSYVYELYAPISAHEFFTHPVFSMALFTSVGKEEYLNIKGSFKLPGINLSSYTDITSKFDMAFKSSSYNENILDENIVNKSKLSISYEEMFDFDALLCSMPKGLMNDKALTKGVKELISNLSFLYSLDSYTMADVLKISVNEKGLVDKDLLKNNSRKFYEYNNDGSLPSLVYKNQPDYLKSTLKDNSFRSKMISVFESTKPFDFLKSKYKGVRPTSKDMAILEMLIVDLKFTPAVCNVLIDYILKTKDNKLIKSYVEVIAGEWKRANLQTAKEAMEYAEKNHKKIMKNKLVVKKEIKEEVIPVWFDKTVNKEDMENSTKEEFEEFFKEYV